MNQIARESILKRLQQNQEFIDDEKIKHEAQQLLAEEPLHAPLLSKNVVDAFMERINRGHVIGTTCAAIDSVEQLPIQVMDYLKQQQLPLEAWIQNISLFEQLDWQNLKNNGSVIGGDEENTVAVSFCDYGIAETGSVVFHSGKNQPVLLNFLGLHHIIVLAKNSIVPLMDDYAAKVDVINPPRNTIWITGASGTTDIEGVLVQGAHGPYQVHIVVVDKI